uniref:Uncharacterized protein n=1 Tax=Setaria italica TaxID=4555 RepID=K3ZGS4_SETIT
MEMAKGEGDVTDATPHPALWQRGADARRAAARRRAHLLRPW